MRIGELASRAGVSVRSLRYYEQQGLLTSTRSAAGQRRYTDDQVMRVELIQWLYAAGLSSRTIAEVLPCVDTPNSEKTAAALKRLTQERDRLTEHIAGLVRTRETLDELIAASTRCQEVRITRKTLLELPEPGPSAPPTPKLPDHPAYQQIMAVFTAADHPLRARQVCEAMDLAVAPNNINNVRLKLKRLADRGILTETEQGLFTQPRP